MLSKLKIFIQILFLLLFFLLIAVSRLEIWMPVFLASTLVAFLVGRFYCGFVCPINTISEGIDWIYKKLKISRNKVPGWIKSPFIRNSIFGVFLVLMALTLTTGKRLPVLPVLTVTGILITMIFVPALWHKYLCPYGVMLSIAGRFSWKALGINKSNCTKCGICAKVCPGDALNIPEKREYPEIDKSSCLECLKCTNACPKNAIVYK